MQTIWDKDFFLGAALCRIVEHQSFKALNKADDKYGHYLINADRRVLMKYSSGTSPWQFTFNSDDLATLESDSRLRGSHYLVLVFGKQTFCCLKEADYAQVIDLSRAAGQRIDVDYPAGRSLRVRGSRGELGQTIPHDAFPKALFA